MNKVSIKKISLFSILAGLIIAGNISLTAMADSYKSYDENIVRAYKTVKIKTLKPNMVFPENTAEEIIDNEINNYLLNINFFQKSLKNKPGIFLVEMKKQRVKDKSGEYSSNININKLYCLKNPEKFMFALNNNLSKKELTDREFITSNISEDASIYAILSEKIDMKNSPLILKAVRNTYNGTLNLIIIIPKVGFGYIFNPVFSWLKTDTASDIYRKISSELEQVSIGDKEQLKVKYYHN